MAKSKQKNKKELKLELPVYDIKGRKVNTVSLNNKVFDGMVNMPLLHQVVMMYQARRRSGCASTKTRAQVRGGGKKPWRQKGTGRARTGSIRNPLWRGGGIIFGPHTRNFSFGMPHKAKQNALRSALNEKLWREDMLIIDSIKLENPKTRLFKSMLEGLGVKDGESVIVILDSLDNAVRLASRNIPRILVTTKDNVSVFDILKYKKLIIHQSALDEMTRRL